jgi:thymidylate synthase (FAD)
MTDSPVEIKFKSSVEVEYIRSMAADEFVAQAARVSTASDMYTGRPVAGLINSLMREKHGSPFEHGMFTFRVHAPIFVFREWMRHRAGWSYNEQSGRYTEFEPVFYVPAPGRPLVQHGKAMDYDLRDGSQDQQEAVDAVTRHACLTAWEDYQLLLRQRVAREVARNVLPVATYSTMYATCNPRSLMHFLALRTRDENATFPSKPQAEIEWCARECERWLEEKMPITYAAWNENGRVAP